MPTAAHAQLRISRLAGALPVHRAFHWLHLHQPQLRHWMLDILAIPAPPFGEAARAEWFLEQFRSLGLSNVHLDGAGNALAELSATETPVDAPVTLVSAHLDTVFPSGTHATPNEDGSRILAPGACDNAAGLTALLGLAAALRYAEIVPPTPILFAANVGEEGEGDLRGMRYLFLDGPYKHRIRAAIALEGAGTGAVVTRALGSRRFRLTVTGPGGHSWTDAGVPNPILLLAQTLSALAAIPLPDTPRTTLNIGQISGGTSINSIPESATALLDLRSTDSSQLRATEGHLRQALAAHQAAIEVIGDRPAAALPDDAAILRTLRAVDRHLSLRTELRIGSTDANIPLSLGIPAIAIGTGGTGGGIHTLAEWYDPTGRELALRRILLTLLATVAANQQSS
jgi:tripeptide aminopeptidase